MLHRGVDDRLTEADRGPADMVAVVSGLLIYASMTPDCSAPARAYPSQRAAPTICELSGTAGWAICELEADRAWTE